MRSLTGDRVTHDSGGTGFDARRVEVQAVDVGDATRRDEDDIRHNRRFLAREVGEEDGFAPVLVFDARHFDLILDRHALLLENLVEFDGKVGVHRRQDAREHFEDRAFRSQTRVRVGKLATDHAAADDDHLARHRLRADGLVRGPDAAVRQRPRRELDLHLGIGGKHVGVADPRQGNPRRNRPRRDHDVLRDDRLLRAVVLGHLNRMSIDERALARDVPDAMLLEQVPDPANERLDDLVLPRHDRPKVEPDVLRDQPEVLGMANRRQGRDGTDHRLGRNTAPVQTRPAQIIILDAHNRRAQLRRANRARIPARSPADHDQIDLAARCPTTITLGTHRCLRLQRIDPKSSQMLPVPAPASPRHPERHPANAASQTQERGNAQPSPPK